MIHRFRHFPVLLLIVGATALVVGASTASAGVQKKVATRTPCWKTLINDWYDGRIDGTYPIHCYRDALNHLPADVDTYSSARDDIRQALQKRITESRHGGGTSTTGGGGAGGGGGGTSSGGGGGSGSGSGNSGNGSQSANGPVGDLFNATKPKNADSLPIPLLVLGGVAFVLMVAGAAGFLTRRTRLRRLQTASAAALPDGSGTSSPEQS